MPRRIHREPHHTDDALHGRSRRARDPVERSRWHFLWLLASGMTAAALARNPGHSMREFAGAVAMATKHAISPSTAQAFIALVRDEARAEGLVPRHGVAWPDA